MTDHTSDAKDTDAMKVLERELWDARQERDQEYAAARRLRAELAGVITAGFLFLAVSLGAATVLVDAAEQSDDAALQARQSAEFWHHVADEAELRERTNEASADFWHDEWKACMTRGMP